MLKTLAIIGLLATNAAALSVAPGRTQVRLKPGASVRTALSITNTLTETLHVEVSQKNWFVLPANKDIKVEEWLRVRGSRQFDLKPGEHRKIPVQVTCPKEAVGELVGMVSFQYITGEGAMVTPMISVSTYLAVEGTEKVSGEITELALRPWKGQLQAAVAVRSTGNVHLRPTGTLVVLDTRDQERARYLINEGDPSYPGQIRGYVGQGPNVTFEAGRYRLLADLRYGDVHLTGTRDFTVTADKQIHMSETK